MRKKVVVQKEDEEGRARRTKRSRYKEEVKREAHLELLREGQEALSMDF